MYIFVCKVNEFWVFEFSRVLGIFFCFSFHCFFKVRDKRELLGFWVRGFYRGLVAVSQVAMRVRVFRTVQMRLVEGVKGGEVVKGCEVNGER